MSDQIVAHLRSLRSERNIAGMRRFGITPGGEQLGVGVTQLRAIAEAKRILRLDTESARWIARNALRELERYRDR